MRFNRRIGWLWACALLALAGMLGVAIAAGADPAASPEPPQVYAKKAGWAESMSATRAAYIEWLGRTGKPDGPSGFQPFDSGSMPGDGPAQRVSLSVAGQDVIRLISICEQGTVTGACTARTLRELPCRARRQVALSYWYRRPLLTAARYLGRLHGVAVRSPASFGPRFPARPAHARRH